MKILFFFFFLFVQTVVPQRLSHSLRAGNTSQPLRTTAAAFPDTVNILAVMVQFQTDNDSRTSGNGQFDLSVTNERIIDAAPHDSSYFSDHFTFAQNYYSKASNGKQHVKGTVLGKVITLKKQMKDYAPVSSNSPLALMIEETWKAVDFVYPGFPFEAYDLFTIFHAGVGHDIDLRAALGYDPTPLDIPSLYFNLQSLKNVFGNSYQGVVLANSSFKIPNSVVLPETEVRRIPSVGGDFVLKLGLNGLLVASIGSHLGLPDLFDTKTGKSAIGRFGLMDGQSIFSFSGIAPPEPSAWEKIFLGWTTPIEVTGDRTLSAPAVGLYASGNDTIFKIPISAKEYFLVENRHRDVNGNGQTVTLKWKGQILQPSFQKDENYFSNSNIDSVYGTVLDVEELDWSLPGLVNSNNNYKGGILVWHVDETIIEKKLSTNSINADPNKRGVDIEEADGSQDIGQSYDFGDPASGTEDGYALDYWFSGNIFPKYVNAFSENTLPNSLSNTLARSHVTMKDFSAQSERMTFAVSVGDSTLGLLRARAFRSPFATARTKPTIVDLDRNGKNEFLFVNNDSLYLLRNDLFTFTADSTGFFSAANHTPAVVNNFSGNNVTTIGLAVGSHFGLRNLFGTWVALIQADSTVTTPVQSLAEKIFIGTAAGSVVKYTAPNNRTVFKPFNSEVKHLALLPGDGWVAVNSDSLKNSFGNALSLQGKTAVDLVNVRFAVSSRITSVVKFSDQTIGIYDAETFAKTGSFSVPNSSGSLLAFADINKDGTLDIIVGTGNSLSAFNINGTLIENFPYKVLDSGFVVGSPVIAGLKNSASMAIAFGSSSGHLYAITEKGRLIPGFPLQTGGVISSPAISSEHLVGASTDSSLYFWKVSGMFDTSKIFWNGVYADRTNSNFIENSFSSSPKSVDLLPKKFAYNWPNPVYSGSTNIRYFLGKSATVTIKIVNLAGELVTELRGTNHVGLDNEVPWDISNIQSGIYFAQISAVGGGEEASQIIKIAVVK